MSNPHTKFTSAAMLPTTTCLALAIEAHANYLVTGDQDLLVLHNIGDCQIVDVVAFEHKISRTRS